MAHLIFGIRDVQILKFQKYSPPSESLCPKIPTKNSSTKLNDQIPPLKVYDLWHYYTIGFSWGDMVIRTNKGQKKIPPEAGWHTIPGQLILPSHLSQNTPDLSSFPKGCL